ncbi:VWA domain-containing protein [Coleofasciculus sp. FACHB-SPT36]|uniref:VWA domain-containing protein n=1 Tax=Cyanophyceae TaxID=3028117 RepID=UPI00168BC4BC|nr:VWA domain-containing protein [Coleofasciculus sp. FACHB-SPT36]
MSRSRRGLWLYPLFQIPLMLLGACIVVTALVWLLGLGRPSVAVAIALDLSSSTYSTEFNAPGTVMYQEVAAVRSYLQQNAQQLRNKNQIQVWGFGGVVRSLTGDFKTDSQQVDAELTQALANPDLPQLVANNTTDINLAIQKGTEALSTIPQKRCRELLLVTDGDANVSPAIITDARNRKVRINTVVIGEGSPELRAAALATGGIYLSGQQNNLEMLFTDTFFTRFNSNLKWLILGLGAIWIALMWTLILPLDRWLLQGLIGLDRSLSGQLSLSNALFWSVLTPLIVWQLFNLLDIVVRC